MKSKKAKGYQVRILSIGWGRQPEWYHADELSGYQEGQILQKSEWALKEHSSTLKYSYL